MERLKEIIEQYSRWAGLSDYIKRIETYTDKDFSISLENSKSLLESICKEICKLRSVEIKPNSSINSNVKKACFAIGLKSNDYLTQISSSLATIGQQLGELRNKHGITSHGKISEEIKERNNKFDNITKKLLIDTTVIIASFLIENYENENPLISQTSSDKKILYDDNKEFNTYWDNRYGEFVMGEYSFTASEIMYECDYKAYKTELKDYTESKEQKPQKN